MTADLMVKTQVATHASTQLSVETKFSLVMELAHKISSSLDLGAVLDLIIDTARSFIHYDSAEIFIVDRYDRARRIKAHTSRGYNGQEQSCKQLKIGDGIVG